MTKLHVVELLNQKLTVRSEADEAHVHEVVELIEKSVQQAKRQSQGTSTLTSVLLVCLNMADELHRLRKDRVMQKEKLGERVRDLIDLVEAHAEDLSGMVGDEVLISQEAL